jgi:DNA-directed RNA polymerase subunit F
VVNKDEDAKYVPISEVKNILKKIETERKEITYEQRIALEHANKFSKISNQKVKELIKDLKKLDFIDEIHINKIVDLLPLSDEDIKTIFAKERINIDDNKIRKILDIVNKYHTG